MPQTTTGISAQAGEMFIYLSEVLHKEVLDADRKLVGKVWDISVKFGEIYPKTDELIVRLGHPKKQYASVPWGEISAIEEEIILKKKKGELAIVPEPKEYEILLRRDILDQQVVDTFNHKVRRVNDVHLLRVNQELMVAHVDIGLRGLFRRLGWEKMVDFIVRAFNNKSPYLNKPELVSWKCVHPVALNPASITMKLSISQKQLSSIPAADLGELMLDLNLNQRMALFKTLEIKTKAKIFENLEFEEQKTMLNELDKKDAALIVNNMSSDEATDLLERLPKNSAQNLLTLMESARAKKLSTLLGYSGDSAGGLMSTDYIQLAENMTAEKAIEFIKNQTRELENIPYRYIVDDKNRLKGATTIRKLLFAQPQDNILKATFPKIIQVHLHDGVKEVAFMMDKYKVSSIPVVDENKTLHGIITMDDILSQVISIAWRKKPRAPKGI
ncbi:MAG: CBS domain-containing protein [Candidatus Gracilibacteria bacterium]|nr:CBS domain-containing protein [Candidatus Gracilibacteria bacterium]